MKYRKGSPYKVVTKKFGTFSGILVNVNSEYFIFQRLGDESFNEKIYCKKEEIISSCEFPKQKLLYYLGTKDNNLLAQIFNSLKKLK